MSKKTKQPASPTVLVITLEADGSGSLLARRGDLAHLSQFTYSGLPEIVEAIQQGATALIEIEAAPPAPDTPPTSADSASADETAVDDMADEGEPSAEERDQPSIPEPVEPPADAVVTLSAVQTTLI